MAGQVQNQRLVPRRKRQKVETVQTLQDSKPRLLDSPLGCPPLLRRFLVFLCSVLRRLCLCSPPMNQRWNRTFNGIHTPNGKMMHFHYCVTSRFKLLCDGKVAGSLATEGENGADEKKWGCCRGDGWTYVSAILAAAPISRLAAESKSELPCRSRSIRRHKSWTLRGDGYGRGHPFHNPTRRRSLCLEAYFEFFCSAIKMFPLQIPFESDFREAVFSAEAIVPLIFGK